jgi:hypothetical protein
MAKPYTSPLSGLQICMEFFFLVFYTTYLVTVLTRRALPTILYREPLSISSSLLLYHRERILETSTLSCNEEEEDITKPPKR